MGKTERAALLAAILTTSGILAYLGLRPDYHPKPTGWMPSQRITTPEPAKPAPEPQPQPEVDPDPGPQPQQQFHPVPQRWRLFR
jgi:hypothetical protein